MTKIDYTQYTFRYGDRGNKKRVKEGAPVDLTPPKPKKNRKGLILVLLLLSFALTFAITILLSGEAVVSTLAGAVSGTSFYAVVADCKDMESARAEAVLARSGGGGGNIVEHGDAYIVVFAAYPTKEEADTVAARAQSLRVQKFAQRKLAVVGGAKYCEQYENLRLAAIEKTYSLILEFARGAERALIVPELNVLSASFADLKAEVNVDTGLSAETKLQIIVAIDTICGRLEGASYVEDDADLLSNLRYQHFAILTG